MNESHVCTFLSAYYVFESTKYYLHIVVWLLVAGFARLCWLPRHCPIYICSFGMKTSILIPPDAIQTRYLNVWSAQPCVLSPKWTQTSDPSERIQAPKKAVLCTLEDIERWAHLSASAQCSLCFNSKCLVSGWKRNQSSAGCARDEVLSVDSNWALQNGNIPRTWTSKSSVERLCSVSELGCSIGSVIAGDDLTWFPGAKPTGLIFLIVLCFCRTRQCVTGEHTVSVCGVFKDTCVSIFYSIGHHNIRLISLQSSISWSLESTACHPPTHVS